MGTMLKQQHNLCAMQSNLVESAYQESSMQWVWNLGTDIGSSHIDVYRTGCRK